MKFLSVASQFYSNLNRFNVLVPRTNHVCVQTMNKFQTEFIGCFQSWKKFRIIYTKIQCIWTAMNMKIHKMIIDRIHRFNYICEHDEEIDYGIR